MSKATTATADNEQGVREVLQSVKVCSVETLPEVMVADLFIRKAVRVTAKDDRKKLSVEVANGTRINFMVACLTPAVYKAAVILKSTPESFDTIGMADLKAFATDKLGEMYSAANTVDLVVQQLMEDGTIDDKMHQLAKAVSSNIADMSKNVVLSVIHRYKSLVEVFMKKLQEVLESEPLKALEDKVDKKDLSSAKDQSELLTMVKTDEAKEVNFMWKEWREHGYATIAEVLETFSPPDAKAILEEARNMHTESIESMKKAVSVLTAIQALFRAMKPGETRKDMAAKCQKLRAKHELPLTPKLTMLLNQYAASKANS